MKRFLLLSFLVLLATACQERQAEPTPTFMPEPTAVVEATPVEAQPTAEPTATPTIAPTPLPTEAPTETPTLTPEASPTSTAVPATDTPAPTATATAVPVADPITVGESQTGNLAEGAFQIFPFTGRQFQPLLFFAEASAGLNLSLAVYGPDAAGEIDLETAVPLTEVNFSDAGRPEIMVFSPNVATDYLLRVQAEAGSGDFTLHTFDPLQQGERVTLAAGTTNEYTVISNGSRPIIIFANPVGQADLAISVTGPDGALIGEADFSGPGSAESFFALPLRATNYTITISEVTGTAAEYDILIIALEIEE
jgi:hypothetical protein